jgi:8-oxo-dGTP diphosphatase
MINCVFENDNKASLRHAVVDAIVIKENKILLVKRAPHLREGNKYCLPGGFIDRDETVEQAVLRELKEETGYDGRIIKLLGVKDDPLRKGDDRQNITFLFLIEPTEKISDPDNETTSVDWFELDKLPAVDNFAFDHYDLIEIYRKYKAGQNLAVFIK